jgi:hypothetical protein
MNLPSELRKAPGLKGLGMSSSRWTIARCRSGHGAGARGSACSRGRNGSLTGFGGALERKAWLLRHEGALDTLDLGDGL